MFALGSKEKQFGRLLHATKTSKVKSPILCMTLAMPGPSLVFRPPPTLTPLPPSSTKSSPRGAVTCLEVP